MTLRKESFVENILRKGENAGNNVFHHSQIKLQFFSHIYFVVCKGFEFGLVRDFVVW